MNKVDTYRYLHRIKLIQNMYFIRGGRYIVSQGWSVSGAGYTGTEAELVRIMLRNWDPATCHVVVSPHERVFTLNVQLIGAIGICAQLSGRCIDISYSLTVSR